MNREQLDRIYNEVMATSVGQQTYGWCGGAAIRAIICTVVESVDTIRSEQEIAAANRPFSEPTPAQAGKEAV